jgi:hypothetical protein|tara:strand:+ start:486 stop:872 length:387 start_codon:yes stop_codon:yes gene_type:complete
MNLEKIFKNLIILQFILFVFFISYGVFFGIEDTSLEEDIAINNSEVALLIVMLIYIINFYFLFKFKSIGKVLFVPLILIIYALCLSIPLEDLYMENHFLYLLDSFSMMIEGGIIAMLYLTNIKDRFEK